MTRVLVVDDDPSVRMVLRMVLEDEGYAVEEEDGDKALTLLNASPAPLVVLLDLFLAGHRLNPIIDALVEDPALATANVYVLMTAGRQTEADSALARLGDHRLRTIMKPFDIDQVLTLVADAAASLPDGNGRLPDGEGASVLLAAS